MENHDRAFPDETRREQKLAGTRISLKEIETFFSSFEDWSWYFKMYIH